MDFSDVFGDLFKDQSGLNLIDKQQAQEATNKSGLTDPKMQGVFYESFLGARKVRKHKEFSSI